METENLWINTARQSDPDSYDGLEVLEAILTADETRVNDLRKVARTSGLKHPFRTAAIERLVELQGSKCRNLLERLTSLKPEARDFEPENVENDEAEVRMVAYEWLATGLCGPVNPKWEEQARKDPYEGINKWF